jgi:hypothetical protein
VLWIPRIRRIYPPARIPWPGPAFPKRSRAPDPDPPPWAIRPAYSGVHLAMLSERIPFTDPNRPPT